MLNDTLVVKLCFLPNKQYKGKPSETPWTSHSSEQFPGHVNQLASPAHKKLLNYPDMVSDNSLLSDQSLLFDQ